ncbi:MAG: glycosyltransferase [Desulfofustis sp.]|nr:glycosyltransferase [Desulfofustis sp.]
MILIYNIIALLLSPFFALWLLVYVILVPEKRSVILQRLGFGLKIPHPPKSKTLWIHALSVGEITSASLLVKQLHHRKSESTTIVFSTTTISGYQLAERLITPYCDALIYYPLDFLPVVRFFQTTIKPDLYIQIETDFWPNLLRCLASAGTTLLLFNGRISHRSMQRYQRFSFFFAPIFDTFSMLCMQTESDVRKMVKLGVAIDKTRTLGNLKFGRENPNGEASPQLCSPLPADNLYVFAGSTHADEEAQILDAFIRLLETTEKKCHLVVAPRKISRSEEVIDLVRERDFSFTRFSSNELHDSHVTIIDTIGDLPTLYRYADISFIGGSLVDEGGHNPLEATRTGSPVLFGPHMDDFSEISQDLLECGAALLVKNSSELFKSLRLLVENESKRHEMGEKALIFSTGHDHVIADHLELINRFL